MYLLPIRMKELRKAAGLTQAAVANEVGVHVVTVTKWETGVMVPRADVLPRLAAALRCKGVGELFTPEAA